MGTDLFVSCASCSGGDNKARLLWRGLGDCFSHPSCSRVFFYVVCCRFQQVLFPSFTVRTRLDRGHRKIKPERLHAAAVALCPVFFAVSFFDFVSITDDEHITFFHIRQTLSQLGSYYVRMTSK